MKLAEAMKAAAKKHGYTGLKPDTPSYKVKRYHRPPQDDFQQTSNSH